MMILMTSLLLSVNLFLLMTSLSIMCLNLMTRTLLLTVHLLLFLNLLLLLFPLTACKLKPLPESLKCSFIGPEESLPIIITSDLH